jgi:hypothetical protein
MRPAAAYVLLRDYKVPDSPYAVALRAGDEITELGRVNAGLVVGLDVRPLSDAVMPRPADDAPRSAWQDYAVVRGVPYAEAVDMDAAELRNRLETQDPAPEENNAGDLPTEGDRKQRWVDYAVLSVMQSSGGQVNEETARDRVSGLTKADLIEIFGPDGDPDRRAELSAPPRTVEQVGPHGDLIVERAAKVDQGDAGTE